MPAVYWIVTWNADTGEWDGGGGFRRGETLVLFV